MIEDWNSFMYQLLETIEGYTDILGSQLTLELFKLVLELEDGLREDFFKNVKESMPQLEKDAEMARRVLLEL